MVREMKIYGLLSEADVEILEKIGYEEPKNFGYLYTNLCQGAATLTARLKMLNKRNFISTVETPEGEAYRMTIEGFKELQKSLRMRSRGEVTAFGWRLELGPLPEGCKKY